MLHQVYCGQGKNMVAFGPYTDNPWKSLWSFPTGGQISGSASISSDSNLVFFASQDGKLYSVTGGPNGGKANPKWPTGGAFNTEQTGITSSPALLASAQLVYIGAGHSVFAVYQANGTKQWSFEGSGTVAAPPAIGVGDENVCLDLLQQAHYDVPA